MVKVCDDEHHRCQARQCQNCHRPRPLPLIRNCRCRSSIGLDRVDLESVMRIDQERKSEIENRLSEAKERMTTEFIAFEILTRLPVKSLLRFKSVCKSWHALISDPSFEAAHLERSRERPQLVILGLDGFLKVSISMYACEEGSGGKRPCTANLLFRRTFPAWQTRLFPAQHCNGLVLLNTQERMIVCNPSTKEFTTLPQGSHDNITFITGCPNYTAGFGFVPSISAYKVGRFFYRSYDLKGKTCDLGFEVITLGRDSSWRVIAQDPPYPIGSGIFPKSVGEVIYFTIENRLHSGCPKAFLSFNLRDEKFKVVDPPSRRLTDYNNMCIVGFEGRPCFVKWSQDRRRWDMWISEGSDEHVWVPRFSFELIQPAMLVLPVAFRHEKLLLKVDNEFHTLVYYDPQSKVFDPVIHIAKDLAFYDQRKCCHHWFHEKLPFNVIHYVESLVPIRPRSRRWS